MEIRENRVRIIQPRFVIDAILVCDVDDPGFETDREAMSTWADEHAQLLASEPYDRICTIVATHFPRVVTVEVTDSDSGCGVIVHPWTGA